MENEQNNTNRVQISHAVFDGLEFVRRSGITNMLDRKTVLELAREWDFTETAEWIESVDSGTYGRLIFQGPDIIEDDTYDRDGRAEPANQENESDLNIEATENDPLDLAIHIGQERLHDLIAGLGKAASLVIADTYATEQIGVLFDPSRLSLINTERSALMRNLAEAFEREQQLGAALGEVQRGIGSLQYLIDPENN